jgi:hypothetical protein
MITTHLHLSKDYGHTPATAGAQLAALLSAGRSAPRRREPAPPLSIDCSGVALSRSALLLLTQALSSPRPHDPPVLLCLNLNRTSLGPQGTRLLALSLRQNRSLQQLQISGCHAGDEGLSALAKVISAGGAAALATIETDKFTLQDRSLLLLHQKQSAQEKKKKKKKKKKKNNNTTKRRQQRSPLLEQDCAVIAAVALSGNNHHRFDLIQGESVKALGCAAIARSLQNNRSLFLRELILQNSFIGDKGAAILARGLAQYVPLELLDLSGTSRIRESGMSALAEALASTVACPFQLLWGRWDSFARVAPLKGRELFLAAVIRHGCSQSWPPALELALPLRQSSMVLLCRLLSVPFSGGGRSQLFLTIPEDKDDVDPTLVDALHACQFVRQLHVSGGSTARARIEETFMKGPRLRPAAAIVTAVLLLSVKYRLPPELTDIVFGLAWDGRRCLGANYRTG